MIVVIRYNKTLAVGSEVCSLRRAQIIERVVRRPVFFGRGAVVGLRVVVLGFLFIVYARVFGN